MLTHLAAFLAVAIVVIVTPGQDTALTVRNTLFGGRRAGAFTAAGVALGQACWTIAASAGLATLLQASEPAFLAVKLAGAAYLVFLGAQALWAAVRRSGGHGVEADQVRGRRLEPRVALRQGLISNLGNPKMAVFFTSLLPQFTGGSASFAGMLVLGLVFCSMTFAWLSGYAVAVAKLGAVLLRPRIRRAIDAVTGAVLVALGVRLATEHR